MLTSDTIAAVASGWTPAPRAMIRLSGPAVPDLLSRLLDPPPLAPRTLTATRLRVPAAPHPTSDIRHPTSARLPCLAVSFPAPRSFTGQDVLELLLPGNPRLLERVLAVICAEPGCREAGPGEFSARAFLCGKMSLSEAEGVAAVIAARSDEELAAAERLCSGQTGREYERWTDELASFLALVEAGIDFSDQEDVVPISAPALTVRLASLRDHIQSFLGAARGRADEPSSPMVVLAGAPNAGKSTLFNALLGRRRAVESPIAGTTRDVLAEPLELGREIPGAPAITLTDLPGLDAAATGAIDRDSQVRARHALEAADVVIHCDPAGRFADDLGLASPRPVLRVGTKADLVRPDEQSHPGIAVCALDGWNLAALRRAIADAVFARPTDGDSACLLPRHRRELTQAAALLDSAIAAAARSGADRLLHAELIAGDLREALDHLGQLTGRVSPDDVIGRIFATFCVGK